MQERSPDRDAVFKQSRRRAALLQVELVLQERSPDRDAVFKQSRRRAALLQVVLIS